MTAQALVFELKPPARPRRLTETDQLHMAAELDILFKAVGKGWPSRN